MKRPPLPHFHGISHLYHDYSLYPINSKGEQIECSTVLGIQQIFIAYHYVPRFWGEQRLYKDKDADKGQPNKVKTTMYFGT